MNEEEKERSIENLQGGMRNTHAECTLLRRVYYYVVYGLLRYRKVAQTEPEENKTIHNI